MQQQPQQKERTIAFETNNKQQQKRFRAKAYKS